MSFITLLWKNLLRRKVRSILTAIGVAVAVATMVALVGVAEGFEQTAIDTFQKRGADIIVVAQDVPNQLSSDLDERLTEPMSQIPGVKLVTPGLLEVMSFQRGDSSVYLFVQGWKVDAPAFNDCKILEGRKFGADEKRVAMLGASIAASLKKRVGDTLFVKNEEFDVIGVFDSFSVYENTSIVVPLAELQRVMGRKNSVTGFSVALEESVDKEQMLEKVVVAIQNLKSGISALPTQQYVTQSVHIQMIHAMAWITTCIALMIGAISMANTMAMSVVERTREIGILRAIGWRKWRVVRMILGEAMILSTVGALFGAIGAVIISKWLTTFSQVGGFIQGDIAPFVIAEGFFIALGIGLVGGIWPAARAASLLPQEAIYHE